MDDTTTQVHGHRRHLCGICDNPMWSGWSGSSPVHCGACGNREQRRAGCDYGACQGEQCDARVPA